jgi:hypothetical protein
MLSTYPDVDMHPVLGRLRLGHPKKADGRAIPVRIDDRCAVGVVVARFIDIPEGQSPEGSKPARIGAFAAKRSVCRHPSRISGPRQAHRQSPRRAHRHADPGDGQPCRPCVWPHRSSRSGAAQSVALATRLPPITDLAAATAGDPPRCVSGAAHVARPLVYQNAGSATPCGRRRDTNESTMDVRGNRMSGWAGEVGRAVDGASTTQGRSA